MPPERSLRIAHFTLGRCNPDSANGIDKTVYHLARTQATLGQSVGVFSITEKPAIPIAGVDVRTYAPVRTRLPLFTARQRDLLAARAPWNVPGQLVEDLLAWRPDVLHLHFVHLPPNVFLARRLGASVPYCVTIHGGLAPAAQRRHYWMKRLFRLLFERTYLERAAFLHALSDQDVVGLQAFGIKNTTVLAPNGVDAEALVTHRLAESSEMSPHDEPKRFLFLGRLDPEQKGLDLLLRGFAAAAVDASLVVAGPDWRGGLARLQVLARELTLNGRVSFPGPVFGAEKIAALQACDVFVHTSRWEGVPMSVLEAAALEKPCLLTPAADPGGLLMKGGGALHAEGTIDQLAVAVRRMAAMTPASLRSMGQQARDTVVREFSWSRTAATLLDAYRHYALGARG